MQEDTFLEKARKETLESLLGIGPKRRGAQPGNQNALGSKGRTGQTNLPITEETRENLSKAQITRWSSDMYFSARALGKKSKSVLPAI